MLKTPMTALRNAPKQQRGQRKVEHILQSAEALFAEIGYEAATTNAIAVRAGVSIGSLYQFFASKEAVLEALADHYLAQTRQAMDQAFEAESQGLGLHHFIPDLIQTILKLQEQRPYFLQCLARSRLTPGVTAAADRLGAEAVARVTVLLKRHTGEVDERILSLRAQICVETAGALLPLALRQSGRERTVVVQEITTLLTGYLVR